MSKQIAIFFDGTQQRGRYDAINNTNVYKLYCLAKSAQANDKTKICLKYVSGIGSAYNFNSNPRRWFVKKIDSIYGIGATQRIKNAYLYLAHCYKNNDKIFLFGFRAPRKTSVLLA